MPEIVPGQLVQITDQVHRITAANPGVMTGPGTNSYLFGRKNISLVDPGPLLDDHIDAIMAGIKQLGGTLKNIIVTHTHMDHSPAAVPLAKKTGATLIGQTLKDQQFQDNSFIPDIELFDGYELVDDEYTLQAIHTPGHVGNHFCFFEKHTQLLCTGDHIMNGSTVVIVPPSGDMQAYIASLKLLLDYPINRFAPAHGDVLSEPKIHVEALIAHRLQREDKVIRMLQSHGVSTIDDLVPLVYDDVNESLHGVAYFSLWAHLEKLQKEHRASQTNKLWQLL